MDKNSEAVFKLAGLLLQSHSSEATIRAAIEVGCELLSAPGASFVPFDEWRPSLPPITCGTAPGDLDGSWAERLLLASTRQACKICQKRKSGKECILLSDAEIGEYVFCIGLRHDGREVGVLSFFFEAAPVLTEDQHVVLAEMVRLVDLALSTQSMEEHLASGRLVANDGYQAILEERARLSREIHDGLAQTLAFLRLEVSRMKSQLSQGETDSLAVDLDATYQTLSDAYLDARQAIDDLRRTPDMCLCEWLKQSALSFEQVSGLPVDLSKLTLERDFAPPIRAQLMRIVQEALTNIRKHAQASHVALAARETEKQVILEIQDDGRGFLPEDALTIAQYGLRGMRERAGIIGADFQVISKPGGGATVRLQIPIQEGEPL